MKQVERAQEIQKIKEWLGSGSINIFGLPFAGKDTHSQELAAQLDGVILGGGDILRNSTIPNHVREAMDQGKLAPTDEFVQIVLPYLSSEEFTGKPLVLSSVGRWRGEEEGVLQAAKASGHELKAVIFLHIDQSVALDRWEHSQQHMTRGKRADDAHHILDVRFEEFNTKTLPVIDYYRTKGLLIEIDGTPSVARVSQDILDALFTIAESKL
jgi:adenylate kinase